MRFRPEYEDVLIHSGRYFMAGWYYTAEGRLPAFEYYDVLDELDQDRFDDLMRFLCETKSRDERFFNFTRVEAKLIVTNAYHKHSQQMTKADLGCLKTAARYKQDYLRRLEDGTYYEK